MMILVVNFYSFLFYILNNKGRLFISAFLFFTVSCTNKESIHLNGFTMGTTYQIKIIGKDLSKEKIQIKSKIDSLLYDFNNIFSTYIDTSEIVRINESIKDTLNISYHMKKIMNESFYVYRNTYRSFDPTIKPLLNLWNFDNDKFSIPDKKKVNNVLKTIGFNKISIEDNYVIKNNINFDFNAIAKGYAVDLIGSYLKKRGHNDFLVEIGGELLCSGTNKKDQWTIGLQNPYIDNGYVEIIKLKNKAIATSGTYINFYAHNGISYSHIINPINGYPVNHKTVSVTVVANNCLIADAYATGLLVLGNIKGLEIVNKNKDIEAMFVTGTKNDYVVEYSENFGSFID